MYEIYRQFLKSVDIESIMNSCKKNNENALAKVLDLFLLPDYNIISTTYLDHLLSHIAENTKECKKNIEKHSLVYFLFCT